MWCWDLVCVLEVGRRLLVCGGDPQAGRVGLHGEEAGGSPEAGRRDIWGEASQPARVWPWSGVSPLRPGQPPPTAGAWRAWWGPGVRQLSSAAPAAPQQPGWRTGRTAAGQPGLHCGYLSSLRPAPPHTACNTPHTSRPHPPLQHTSCLLYFLQWHFG